ncbi:hypothetical protein V8C86DRAFT_1665291 [Haematococcus lacustris]
MDAVAKARSAQLRGYTAGLTGDARRDLSDLKVQEICSKLSSHGLLVEAQFEGCSPSVRADALLAIDEWFKAVLESVAAKLNGDGAASDVSLTHKRHSVLLLGASAASCDASRLLHQHQAWGSALAEHFKQLRDSRVAGAAHAATASDSNMVAVCTALSHLVSRLCDFVEVVGVRRDLAPLVARLGGLLLALLTPQLAGSPCCLASLDLLSVLLTCLPSSLRGHVPSLTRSLAALALQPCSHPHPSPAPSPSPSPSPIPPSAAVTSLLLCRVAAVRCLVSLPRALGDAAAYSDCFRGLLLSLAEVLDGVFQGLEDQGLARRSREGLDGPPGGEQGGLGGGASGVPSLTVLPAKGKKAKAVAAAGAGGAGAAATGAAGGVGGQGAGLLPKEGLAAALTAARAAGGQSESVSLGLDLATALLSAVETLLGGAYPVAVPLPCGPLLHLATRLLRFSPATVLTSGRTPPSSSGFQTLLAQLPCLHQAAWHLLTFLLTRAGLAAAGLHASMGRLMAEWLRQLRVMGPSGLLAVPPAVRLALYCCTAAGCQAPGGGLGMAVSLAPHILGAVAVELYAWTPQQEEASNSMAAVAAAAGASLFGSRGKAGGGLGSAGSVSAPVPRQW